ncbi:MAG: glucose-1-phosphate adenylyltransferase [Clostridia bacterium]|nr:glucose-1-phosphate adenylyltransferase [Clostridia bacterium]
MKKKKLIAMLLAGGQGSRLGVLTNRMAKPAVPYGGKYRIIDFPLSNCVNSDIDTVGVLTQYEPLELNAYLGTGQAWDLDRLRGGVYVLPPYVTGDRGQWYSGTANAIFQNMAFIDQFDPDDVLILSGDHIYKMDYHLMHLEHMRTGADCTIAVLKVPMEEASRFGIMNTDAQNRIVEFEEKPQAPKSDKASMGIYIFSWKTLKDYLLRDSASANSHNDFGKDIIPSMLSDGLSMFAYPFTGYWKDVGTISSLWEANMDLICDPPKLDLYDKDWRIYSKNAVMPPHFVSSDAHVEGSLVTEGSNVYGNVYHSVLFSGCHIGQGAVVRDSVIMPGAVIGDGATVLKAIVGENARVGAHTLIGCPKQDGDPAYDNSLTGDITLIADSIELPAGKRVPAGMVVSKLTADTLSDNGGASL